MLAYERKTKRACDQLVAQEGLTDKQCQHRHLGPFFIQSTFGCQVVLPVTRGSLDSTRKRQMLGELPWMFLSNTCSPYSSAARSLPIAAASLRRAKARPLIIGNHRVSISMPKDHEESTGV